MGVANLEKTNRFLTIAKRFASSTAFTVAFATTIRNAGQDGSLNDAEAKELFLQLAVDIVSNFKVEIQKTAKREKSGSDCTKDSVHCLLSGQDTASFLHHLEKEDMKTETQEVLSKLENEAASNDPIAFESFFLPLLHHLIQLHVPLAEPRYKKLFRDILLAYATRYVQPEPTTPGDWARRPEGCGCSDCYSLDRFLTDPSLQLKRFPVSKSRRHHLHCMLNDTEYTHETDRKGVETLVVTKPASRSTIKFEQWKTRFLKAKREIENLDQGVLREMLGEDFVFLSRLRAASLGKEEMPSMMRRRRGKAAMARRVEVVDLT